MKTIKVDIATEVRDIDARHGVPVSFVRLDPLGIAKAFGENVQPTINSKDIQNYYPHKVYTPSKGTVVYLVKHSDKGIFEDLIRIADEDIAFFRQKLRDEFYKEEKPTDEFLRHYYRDVIDEAREKWEKTSKQNNRVYQDKAFYQTIFKADMTRHFILVLLVFCLIGLVANLIN